MVVQKHGYVLIAQVRGMNAEDATQDSGYGGSLLPRGGVRISPLV